MEGDQELNLTSCATFNHLVLTLHHTLSTTIESDQELNLMSHAIWSRHVLTLHHSSLSTDIYSACLL